MLEAIDANEIREIAALAKAARAVQDRLLNKMRIVDRFEDGKELAAQTAETLDVTLDNEPLHQLRSRIAGLAEEARLELAAVMLVGRGDVAAQQWTAALDEARGRGDASDAEALARKPDLAEYLAKGLFQLDAR
jgi:hypothetical protein